MVGWHHQLNGHEFEQTQGDSEGQGSLACLSMRLQRVRHDLVTELNGNVDVESRLTDIAGEKEKVGQIDRVALIIYTTM